MNGADEPLNPPAATLFRWACPSGVGDSSVPGNWTVDGVLATRAPGAGDDLYFPINSSSCSIKQTAANSLRTEKDWAGTLRVDGGVLTVAGDSYLSCNIAVGSSLWFAGPVTLEDCTLTASGTGTRWLRTLGAAELKGTTRLGVSLENIGTLTVKGWVEITDTAVQAVNYGTFALDGVGYWATPGNDPTVCLFTNHPSGTLLKTGAGAFTFGSYLHSEGRFALDEGSLSLTGRATDGGRHYSMNQRGGTASVEGGTTLAAADTILVTDAASLVAHEGSAVNGPVWVEDATLRVGGFLMLNSPLTLADHAAAEFAADWETGALSRIVCPSVAVAANASIRAFAPNPPTGLNAKLIDTTAGHTGDFGTADDGLGGVCAFTWADDDLWIVYTE